MKSLAPQVERLKGEKDLLEKENRKLKDKFSQARGNLEEYNVHQTLFKMDPQRYGQTIGDLNQRPEAYPVWADIDFLERANSHEENKIA